MNYEEMSDFKVNLKVANLVRDEWLNVSRKEGSETCLHIIDSNGAIGCTKHSYIDYCNNPADAWPIIVNNMISIEFDGEDECDEPVYWVNAKSLITSDVCVHQSNPLRAAMICFLMMKDADNA